MAKLSIGEIYAPARAAGFTPQQATTWTAIAMAESGGQPGALNDKGEHSMGLWQINVARGVRTNRWGDLNDPLVNARAAFEISHQGRDMRPWTTTHDVNKSSAHDYRTYLAQVEQVTGVRGDPRGVHGYGSPLPPPLSEVPAVGEEATSRPASVGQTAPAGYDQITTGRPASAASDAESDGLTDEFERRLGTNPSSADTDGDGLPDGFEVGSAHTDPRSADTDLDGLSDGAEQALGTRPTALDSDRDGISDRAEVGLGTDPLVADARTGALPLQREAPAPLAPSPPADAPAVAASTPSTTHPGTLVDEFVRRAQAQAGDPYVYGAEANLGDPNPKAFDCSELTQWAAKRAGVTIPDGAEWQYLDLKAKSALVPVEQALKTKGALLFYFSREPKSGLPPGQAHVAVSLGDGRTIEARGRAYGVGEFEAGHRFNYAGIIPEMSGPSAVAAPASAPTVTDALATTPPGSHYDRIDPGVSADRAHDTDTDGLIDTFEQIMGTDPTKGDTDNDGIGDAAEYVARTDPGHGPGPAAAAAATFSAYTQGGGQDADADGLSDIYEHLTGLNPSLDDTDADGISDGTEVLLGTDPLRADLDGDGRTDGLEVKLGTDPLQGESPSSHVGQLAVDPTATPHGAQAPAPVDLSPQ